MASIGPSISIRGDLSGEENLIIQGRVDGTIDLKENCLTIGKEGRVKASIRARVIKVEGHLEGNLHGRDQVVVRRSGVVLGDIVTPRIALEDGCRFKGFIDMDVARKEAAAPPTNKVSDIKSAVGLPGSDAKTPIAPGKPAHQVSNK
jgi:cytoskeletal protein CcmA (bactofilin family)